VADITSMSGLDGMLGLLTGYPDSYWQTANSGGSMTPYYWVPGYAGYDPSMIGQGMPMPPDAPQPPPASPQVPPVPSAPPSAPMPTPGLGSAPPGLLNPPPAMTPSPMAPPPMMPPAPPPPMFGDPGYVPLGNKSPIGRGGTGRQGGSTGGGGYGSGAMGGGAQGGAMGPNGEPKGMATGGYVPGDSQGVDDQRINATSGEFMLRKASADALGPYVLSALNDPKLAPKLGPVIQKAVDEWIASRR
jgi:hypothetical protein